MKRHILCTGAALWALCSCGGNSPEPDPGTKPEPEPKTVFAKGADLGWVTQMEDKGFKFYNAQGQERECTALMKELGCNAVRHRVWVDPKAGETRGDYCGLEDLLVKCRRVRDLGMDLMVDFHYADGWADPGKQPVPASWTDHSAEALAERVAEHTSSVLNALKSEDIDVKWVQVGNEVTNGMLWETCRVKGQDAAAFVKVFNAGAKAVKEVYPDAKVILHIDNAWKTETVKWFYDLAVKSGARFDIIGLSLYPSYWEGSSYPAWETKTHAAVNYLRTLYNTYKKPVMFVEFGMPASEPEKAKAALQYIMDNTSGMDFFQGIFLWEPESEKSRNGYDYGAFSGGKPTAAMDPFRNPAV